MSERKKKNFLQWHINDALKFFSLKQTWKFGTRPMYHDLKLWITKTLV